MKHVSIHSALQYVADNPEPATDELIQLPAWELISRAVFELANRPDSSVRGANSRANKARQIILNRLVGRRRAGSHPATRGDVEIEFVDLTGGGELNGKDT